MGKEEKFYKKHPIISGIVILFIGGILVFLATQWLMPSTKEFKSEVHKNGEFHTTYNITNNGILSINGVVQIEADKFNEIDVNEYGKISDKSDNKVIIKFQIPGGEIFEVKTATSTVVEITRLK